MATLKQIRGRIKAAKSIQQITRAMKLVAAARFKRATERALAARPYSEKLKDVVSSLSGAGELPAHPLLERNDSDNYALILVTAERGLCGSYNTNLIRRAAQFLRETPGVAKVIGVGKKGALFFGKRGYEVVCQHTLPSAGASFDDAKAIAKVTQELFESGEVSKVYLCYAKFYSAIRQVPQVVQLLPIEPPETEEKSGANLGYIFEPTADTLVGTLLPRYFLTLLWQALLEATASEFAARMTAMTNATENAGKMIQNLTLKANRERQATITKEILEVVSGAEALKS
ncbi:MAG: ATP synthase F1 subunit gamma [Fimbriimonadaceae bacterium]|nr:ATP synthase gamma chain [Fimbriimonadaceae bacterium]MCC6352166.1 ATP synthase F1 subunit gamma [Fimbriimonadaceae bacterium]MCL4284054.1 ATP synthase F1 subunit gamma [Fimbriimonadaceae bacterium]QOJ12870.1 MAG: ATP synthase F1 subunit gamma [Chthonomonadaceae bacterium]